MELNLKAVCEEDERILKYLKENASEELAEKINKKAERPIIPCLVYLYDEAKKLYEQKKEKHNCIMVDDQTVFGWAVHYYEDVEAEEDIKRAQKLLEQLEKEEKAKAEPKPKVEQKPKEVKVEKPSAEKIIKAYKQLSLLEELGL